MVPWPARKKSNELVVRLIGLAPVERCHQVPLLGGWHQAHVAVRGDALSVENHLHSSVFLIHENGMVRAVVKKNAKTLSIEVILVGHLHGKIGAGQAWGRDHGQEETNSDSRKHRLGLILLLCANMI
jgi:hypothetical protein